MNFWILSQIVINLILFATVVGLWIKLHKPAKDDPRLSRGLQLLQSKIAVLEDLSDRTETQVSQLNAIMEQKVRDIQNQLLHADKQIQKIDVSMAKSLEVAEIFQDKIPHQEIIERKNSQKYIQAAKMAHEGASIDEIAEAVELTRGEVEFVAKVNRHQIQIEEPILPKINTSNTSSPKDSLSELGEQFRKAMETQPTAFIAEAETEAEVAAPPTPVPTVQVQAVKPRVITPNATQGPKKVVFPKVELKRI